VWVCEDCELAHTIGMELSLVQGSKGTQSSAEGTQAVPKH